VTNGPTFGWALAAAFVALLLLALAGARWGRVKVSQEIVVAAIRACVQLVAVSAVIGVVLQRWWSSVLFAMLMFSVAVWTAAGRIAARRNWPWVAAALGIGAIPVLVVVFSLGAAPFDGAAIIPIAGIVIGGSMTAHTLAARRAFDTLRSDLGQVEAGLALGLPRRMAIDIVTSRHAPEALVPVLDQTRTVGLVTLPGAFVGVLLGGGSAAEAAATQVLVLVGLIAAETIVVAVSYRLIADGRILPLDVVERIPSA
jgi:putative ABC transport system permease protein